MSLWPIAYFLFPVMFGGLVVAVIALIVRGRTPDQRVRLIARIAQWGSLGVGVLYAFSAVRDIYKTVVNESVAARIEVSPFWPVTPREVSVASRPAHVDIQQLGDGFTSAHVHLTGLSATTRGLIALDYFAQLLAVVALCLLIARVARGIADGKLFEQLRARELVIAGTVFGITGATALFANGFAQAGIMNEAAPRQIAFSDMSWTGTATDSISQVFGIISWSWSVNAPTWTFIAAVIAFVAAMVVRRGNQLESENEGLI